MSDSIITLTQGRNYVEIDPLYGGRVTSFWSEGEKGRIDWFVPTLREGRDLRRPYKAGMFPLVPFSNRIRDAVFTFGGEDFVLERTEYRRAHAIHGHGCWTHWSISHQAEASASIFFVHSGADWPSSYKASQHFILYQNNLLVRLVVENKGVTSMPVGLGLHPFFPQRRRVTLKTDFRTIWPGGADSIPIGPEPLSHEFDFTSSRDLPIGLDTGFGGWNGRARLTWPLDGIALAIKAISPLGHAIIYTPVGEDFFCFEPVSHPTNAINLDAGMPTIGPGQKFGASVIYQPTLSDL